MSTTFTATTPTGDPSLDSFTWKGNQQFYIPSGPLDQILWLDLNNDWGGHGEYNHVVQFFWQHDDGPSSMAAASSRNGS